MNRLALALFTGVALFAVPDASAQERAGVADVLSRMRNGGGWVEVPIAEGHGSFSTVRVPMMALTIAGCVNVWHGHSGTWAIEAREQVLGSVLRVEAKPGVGVPFEHDFGMQAQVDIDFRWSEARDTTLMLWVGLDLAGEGGESVCEPDYGDDGP
ncbi:MAG: hypothetical protein L7U50_03955 [Candidatus Nanopelagicales bacterium]|nr:hypothetical protein [Candidatus Nanopelagicales bacterium]